jgi:ABC-type sugar transport system substrate-binding protein
LPDGPDSARLIGSIVPDNEIAGYEMALSLIEAARGAGLDDNGIQMLALLGDAATPAALARQAGLERALSDNGGVTLVRALPVMWDQATAQERTAKTLQRHRLDAVWSANDQIALGAQVAALDAGERIGETIFFAGLNWSREGLEAVRDGRMTMTHGGHFFAGAWSMVMLRDIEDGRLVEDRHVSFPMSAIGPDAVEDFLAVFGTRDWRSIDFARFRLQDAGGSYDFSAGAILSATAGTMPRAN